MQAVQTIGKNISLPTQKHFLLKYGKTDLTFFYLYVLGFCKSKYKPAPFHYEWLADLQTLLRICKMASRDFAKTTIHSRVYILWRMFRKPHSWWGLIKANEDLVKKDLEAIQEWIESNPLLQHLKGKPWSSTEMGLSNGSRLIGAGVGSGFRGITAKRRRLDGVLLDDIYAEKMHHSFEFIDRWFRETVSPTVEPHTGQIIVIGTPFHHIDLYHVLMDNTEYDFKQYPACTDEYGNPCLPGEEGAIPMWPDRCDLEYLKGKMAEVGSLSFSREYLCQALDVKGGIFPSDWLNYFIIKKGIIWKFDPVNKKYYESTIKVSDLIIWAGHDPSGQSKDIRRADYYAIVTLGYHKATDQIFQLSALVKKGNIRQQVEDAYSEYKKWRWSGCNIEVNIFQSLLKKVIDEYRDILGEDKLIPYKSLQTNPDKYTRIEGLSHIFGKDGHFWVQENQQTWINQYLAFFNKDYHDDGLDGTELAWHGINMSKNRMMPRFIE